MSANDTQRGRKRPDQARRNLRVGLVLASIAAVAFFGVMLRYWVLK